MGGIVVAERPSASPSLSDKEKFCEPSAHAALRKAAAPIMLILKGPDFGVDGVDGTESETSETLGTDTDGAMAGAEIGAELGMLRNFTLRETQSINGLCRVSQSSPKTVGKSESNWVTKYRTELVVPQGNRTERKIARVIEGRKVPLMRRSGIGGIGKVGRLCFSTKLSSMKECEEPLSIKQRKDRWNCLENRERERESELTTALSLVVTSAQGVWQSSICAVSDELPNLFSFPGRKAPEQKR